MRHFLFEDKEYTINPHFKRRWNREQDSVKALARLLRTAGRSGGKRSFGSRGVIKRTIDTRQKCVVKMQYSDSHDAHRLQLEKYLVREGTDINGGQAKLYGTDIDEYRKNMVERNFRIFLSPQSGRVDLKVLAEKFMLKLQRATGHKLYWQAANHYNTAHPHAHLLINGVDKAGKQVEIPKDIVKIFMREYARDICTTQLGIRTRTEIELEKEQELTARRYTGLDRRIKELCNGTFTVNIAGAINTQERERLMARIESLRKMNLCVYKDGAYKLSPRWEEDLRANGRYNTFLKARSVLRYSKPASLRVFSGGQGQLTGKVTKVYRTDGDASDNHAVILEGLDGRAYFVPLFKRPEVWVDVFKNHKEPLREGTLVSIKTYEGQQGRLTPIMFKREASQIRNEIQKKGYSGTLALELLHAVDRKEKHIGRP